MLRSLQIKNIAVIRSAEIEFGGGFSALTGETGAGKSIIIDSINLLLGNRATRELIRTGEDKASVSALFEGLSGETLGLLDKYGIDCPDGTLLLSRTVNSDGRGIARVNGQTVTLPMLREIGSSLISIHGQHDNARLMQKSSHIALLDAYAGLSARLEEYSKIYREYKDTERELDSLKVSTADKMRLRDMLMFQLNEINAAKLRVGEEEELTAERLKLQNAERIKKQTDFAYRALYGGEKVSAALLLERSAAAIGQLSGVIVGADEIAAKLEEFRYEVEDIAQSIRSYSDVGEGDPTARLDKIEGRLELISRLKRKYGVDIAAILAFRDDVAGQLEKLDTSESRAEGLTERLSLLEGRARDAAAEISIIRRDAAARAARAICDELAYLDMPGVKFEIEVTSDKTLRPDGTDDVEFLIAANPGEPPMPLIKTASGGELSRIMLALKCVMSANEGVSAMIFDEVDTGISGKTSRKVGIKLKEISRTAQVLCVTHSAQIASLADEHLLISKSEVDGRAETSVKLLDMPGRIDEIARILGGIDITDKQREAAREMIEEGLRG